MSATPIESLFALLFAIGVTFIATVFAVRLSETDREALVGVVVIVLLAAVGFGLEFRWLGIHVP